MVSLLVEAGHEVCVFGPKYLRGFPEPDLGRDPSGLGLRCTWHQWQPDAIDLLKIHLLHPIIRKHFPGLDSRTGLLSHRRKRAQFGELALRFQPDACWFHYAFSVANLASIGTIPSICDVLDLVSLNYSMQRIAGRGQGREPLDAWRDAQDQAKGLPTEFGNLARFDGRISISDPDHERMVRALGTQRSVLIRTVHGLPAPVDWKEGLPAGMFLGDNPLNRAGLEWFATVVLPRIRAILPTFRVLVGGQICDRLPARAEGLEFIGSVACPEEFYRRVGYVLCPTYLGTGEQHKIVEAMGNGRATVSFGWMSSPATDGLDGFRESSAEGWVDAVLRLETGVELQRRMGSAALESIRSARGGRAVLPILETFLRCVVSREDDADRRGRP